MLEHCNKKGTIMKSLIIAFVVGCLAYCNGQDSTCVTSPPREAVIDGQTDVQSTEIQGQIDEALKNDNVVRLAVDSLSNERALVYQQDKISIAYRDTCPRNLRYITSLYVYIGSGKREKCYVVNPYRQRVVYALCKGTNCYGNTTYKSQCVRSGWTRLQFWVWCPTCGFKLIARWYPQCCSCYRWTPCLTAVDDVKSLS
ncbi:uncharacterized protein LOC111133943 [Crassostrea virginica]